MLGERLRYVRLMLDHRDKLAPAILGSPDDLKFRSCLTLFHAAASDESDRALFTETLKQFYDGKPDARAMEILGVE